MAKETLLSFNTTVKAGDFTQFHGEISELWKREVMPDKLKEVFAQFIKNKIDLDNQSGNSYPSASKLPSEKSV